MSIRAYAGFGTPESWGPGTDTSKQTAFMRLMCFKWWENVTPDEWRKYPDVMPYRLVLEMHQQIPATYAEFRTWVDANGLRGNAGISLFDSDEEEFLEARTVLQIAADGYDQIVFR